jgi:acyl-CoA synthetase
LPVTKMPLTTSGKIIKRELVRWVEDGRVRPLPVRLKVAERQSGSVSTRMGIS